MSTTKIREMVATYGRSMSAIQAKRLKAEVLVEVEAIEKAARALGSSKANSNYFDAVRLMDDIDRESGQ